MLSYYNSWESGWLTSHIGVKDFADATRGTQGLSAMMAVLEEHTSDYLVPTNSNA